MTLELQQSNTVRLAWQPQANEIFVVMQKKKASEIREKGAVFFEWQAPIAHSDLLQEGEDLYRLVTSFATTSDEIEAFISCLKA